MDKNRKKRVGTMSVVILSAFAVAAIGFTGARYYSELKGTGSVGIAKFSVTVGAPISDGGDLGMGETPKLTWYDETNAGYSFSVTSNSEVAVSYDVVVKMNKALPNGVALSINGIDEVEIAASDPTVTTERVIYTFKNVGKFTADGGAKNHTLKISLGESFDRVNETGITVQVVAEQFTAEEGA